MVSGKSSFLVFFVLWGLAQGTQKTVQSEPSDLTEIETKSALPLETVNATLDRVKRLEDENSVQFDDARSLNNARLTDLQALEKLQRFREKGVTDSPRGVQDQFIEMLGNSKEKLFS